MLVALWFGLVASLLANTVTPSTFTLSENATRQLSASTPSTWATNCGSVSSAGLFRAPLTTTTCTITATATNGSGAATTKATVTSPITITPASPSTAQGGTQQFTANVPVVWWAKCGAISSSGLYTASGTVGSYCTIRATAASGTAYVTYAYDHIVAGTTASITPANPTILEGATQQFSQQFTSTPTWSASCGSISTSGLYTAPMTTGTCTITATGSGKTASTTATITSNTTLAMSPTAASTPQGQTQQFTANAPVTWSVQCGSIDQTGLYTASAPVGTNCTVRATTISTPSHTVYGYDHILAPVTNTIAPLNPTISEAATQKFTSTVASTWTATCGSIDPASGLYTAPLAAGACTVTATATSGGQTASTSATITSPLIITPSSANTGAGLTQQFTANLPTAWVSSCGSISGTGLFTASAAQGSKCTITATATSSPAYTATALDTVGAAPVLTISPLTPTLSEAATQQFTATVASTWTATCGSIDAAAGLYTAPLVAGPCTVTATATSGGQTTSTTATITSPLVITPSSANTGAGLTQQFTANLPAAWVSSCGSISGTGLFTASAAQGSKCTITATATSSPAYTATALDTVGAAQVLTISPLTPTLSEAATQQFTATVASTWTATCGSIDPASGLYTAPLAAGSCTVTATATSGGQTTSTTATITSPLVITPSSANTGAGLTQQFTANLPAAWVSSCGSISGTGLFTASAAQGSKCTITATATSSPAYTATALDTVGAAPVLTISPLTPTLSEAATQQFTATVASTWSATCGSIDSAAGLYTAPLAAGPCTVTATATSGGQTTSTTASITSPIVITPTSATTVQGQTQQFTANMPVTWSSSCGSIDANAGLYTASATQGSHCTITATATGSTAYTATATDVIGAAVSPAITPTNPTILQAATQQFTANFGATWTATCGSIDPAAGLYTAPVTSGACTVTATATGGGGQTASTTATINSPLTITPAGASIYALGQIQFSAGAPMKWSSSCGTIDANAGLFTAPATPGNCTISATAASGTAYTAQTSAAVVIVNYTTWKNNTTRDGEQEQEFLLTPSNVNATSFGVKWTAGVDSTVLGQPLYMNAVSVNGTPHNMVFVGTANDSVYAFDADMGTQLWMRSFLSPGVTYVPGSATFNKTQIGIVGTPVIDPDTQTLYVVAMTSENSGATFVHRLHALDITTGNDRSASPVVISDPNFTSIQQNQRPALLLSHGRVYVSFAGIGDNLPYHGFVFAYDELSLARTGVFNDTIGAGGGGIWLSAGGPSADAAGNVYVSTGNGDWDGTSSFGDSVVKLSSDLMVLDYFTAFDQAALSAKDLDLASGAVLLLPDQSGSYPHEMIICGKGTPIYVINRDALGGMGSTTDNIIQRLDNVLGATGNFRGSGQPCFTTPAIWRQNVYFVANHDVLKSFLLDGGSGLLSAAPASQDSFVYTWPGAQPVVSSNGDKNGIVWTVDPSAGALRANDATDVSKALYASGALGKYQKWQVPTVVNGHVFVAMQNTLVALGLN